MFLNLPLEDRFSLVLKASPICDKIDNYDMIDSFEQIAIWYSIFSHDNLNNLLIVVKDMQSWFRKLAKSFEQL